MGVDGSESGLSEEGIAADRKERLQALSDALLQRGTPPEVKPPMLFGDAGLDIVEQGEADKAETVTGIDAQN